jgi:hypothetical protein
VTARQALEVTGALVAFTVFAALVLLLAARLWADENPGDGTSVCAMAGPGLGTGCG